MCLIHSWAYDFCIAICIMYILTLKEKRKKMNACVFTISKQCYCVFIVHFYTHEKMIGKFIPQLYSFCYKTTGTVIFGEIFQDFLFHSFHSFTLIPKMVRVLP